MLLEGHDNRRDTAVALSWLSCGKRVGSDDLWRSLPTDQGDCLGKMKCSARIMDGTKKGFILRKLN